MLLILMMFHDMMYEGAHAHVVHIYIIVTIVMMYPYDDDDMHRHYDVMSRYIDIFIYYVMIGI